ncbi:MAG: hypothetical protein MRY49_01360 [Candidatus Pacebacteria bacterium]|nr:hypothetical protein [Candidatus Paceibacterota bacterium]
MDTNPIIIVFAISLVFVILLLIINHFEKRSGKNIFQSVDPVVQKFVSRLSKRALLLKDSIRNFVLVKVYNMSGDTPKPFWNRLIDRKENLLNKLRGNHREFAKVESTKEVSPFLKEMSKFDNLDR